MAAPVVNKKFGDEADLEDSGVSAGTGIQNVINSKYDAKKNNQVQPADQTQFVSPLLKGSINNPSENGSK